MPWLKKEIGGDMSEVEELQKRVAGLEEDVNTLSGILLEFVKKAGLVDSRPATIGNTTDSNTAIPPHLAGEGFSTTASTRSMDLPTNDGSGIGTQDFSNDANVNELVDVFSGSNETKAKAEEQAKLVNAMMRK